MPPHLKQVPYRLSFTAKSINVIIAICCLTLFGNNIYAQTQAMLSNVIKIGNGRDGFPNILNQDHFGGGITDIGDLDGDGIHDIAIGAYSDVITAGVTQGSVYICFMKADGTIKSYFKNVTPSGAIGFGISIASIGDLDGDGIQDLVVGAYGDNNTATGLKFSGSVYICFLKKTGAFKSTSKIAGNSLTGFSSQTSSGPQFGKSVALIGDIDKDGVNDIIVGCGADKMAGGTLGTTATGSAYIICLKKNGTLKSATRLDRATTGLSGFINNNDAFGTAVAGLGDMDGDTIPDIAVGVPNKTDINSNSGGVLIIHLTSTIGIKSVQKISDSTQVLNGLLPAKGFFGSSIAYINDFSFGKNTCRKNGTKALIVGEPSDNDVGTNSGAVWLLFLDSASGKLVNAEKISGLNPKIKTPSYYISSASNFGYSVCNYKSLDTNGTQRVFVGAPNDSGGNVSPGTGAVYLLDFKKFDVKVDTILVQAKTICTDSSVTIGVVYDNLGNEPVTSVPIKVEIIGKDSFSISKTFTGTLATCSRDTVYINIPVKASDTGNYKLRAYVLGGGNFNNSIDSVNIHIHTAPQAFAGVSGSYCLHSMEKLGATAVTTDSYQWSSRPAGFSATTSNPVVEITQSITYYLTETNKASGCQKTDSVVIKALPLPTAVAGKNKSLCGGTSDTLGTTPVSGLKYSWTSDSLGFISSNSSIVITSLPYDQIYRLTVTDNTSKCSQSDSVTIKALPSPILKTISNSTICKGASVSLGSTSVSTDAYKWASVPAGFSSTSSNPVVSPNAATSYTLTETNTSSGCHASRTVLVNISVVAAKTVHDTAICTGKSLKIGADTVAGSSYSWASHPTGFSSLASNPTAGPTTTTEYYLTEKNILGCTQTDSVQITVNPLPAAYTIISQAICKGSSVFLGRNTVVGDSYLWSSSPSGFSSTAANPSVSPVVATTYTLTETNPLGCVKSNSLTLTLHPVLNASWFQDYVGNTAYFHAVDSSMSDSFYHWHFGDGDSAMGHLVSHLYKTFGTFKVSLQTTNIYGCSNEHDSMLDIVFSGIQPLVHNPIEAISLYPNPFSTTTTLSYLLSQKSRVSISLFDFMGKQVQIMATQTQVPGSYQIEINADSYHLAPGMYLMRFVGDGGAVSRNMIKL